MSNKITERLAAVIEQATPLPWEARENGHITTSAGVGVATILSNINPGRALADQLFIVHAVNNFGSMVEALKCLLDRIDTGSSNALYSSDFVTLARKTLTEATQIPR